MKGIQISANGAKINMKINHSAIALAIGAATASGLILLKVKKDLVVGFSTIIVGAALIIASKRKDALNTRIRDYEYFFNRAQDKCEVGNYKEAIIDYNKALELSPIENCLIYSMRGNAKRNLGDLEGAISDQNKALSFDPLYADGYFNRSSAKYMMRNFAGSIDDYSQVIKINPKDSDAFFNRAKVKKKIGDIKGACEDLRKAANLGDEEAKKFYKSIENKDLD